MLGFRNPKSRDLERGGQFMVRNDLQKDLEEVYDKLPEANSTAGPEMPSTSALAYRKTQPVRIVGAGAVGEPKKPPPA